MGREHPMETVERAEEAYCLDGLTFDAAADRVGVAVSTVKRWSERYGWQAKRDEVRRAMQSIRLDTIRLRAKLITNCLISLNAMDAFAVAKMEEMAIKASEVAAQRQPASPPPARREIRTDADAIAALDEAVSLRLSAMLADPGQVSLSAIKEVKAVLDLLRDMRAAAGAAGEKEPEEDRGLSASTADRIRALLGGQE